MQTQCHWRKDDARFPETPRFLKTDTMKASNNWLEDGSSKNDTNPSWEIKQQMGEKTAHAIPCSMA